MNDQSYFTENYIVFCISRVAILPQGIPKGIFNFDRILEEKGAIDAIENSLSKEKKLLSSFENLQVIRIIRSMRNLIWLVKDESSISNISYCTWKISELCQQIIVEDEMFESQRIDSEKYLASVLFDDYNFIFRGDFDFSKEWSYKSLWLSEKPSKFEGNKSKLGRYLKFLRLGFLFDILGDAWRGQEIDNFKIVNLSKNLSVTIINNSKLLEKAISLGGVDLVHSVRNVLIGPGGAGKSSLSDRLQQKPIDHCKRVSLGIDYLQHQSMNLNDKFPEYDLKANALEQYLWDFGGQTIFHGLHSAFLHENCVYILVIDSRHEQSPDEWLHQINHLAGSQAKVLLVTNWYEKCETYQNETRLLREFPGLLDSNSFFYFSCLDSKNPNFEKFVKSLVEVSLDSQKMVLKETLDIHKCLKEKYNDDVFINSVELDEIVEKVVGRSTKSESIAKELQQLGFLVQVDSDEESYCLKPSWVIDHAYEVFYSSFLREKNGIITLKELKAELKDKVEVIHVKRLIDFLQERSLCQKLRGNNEYFFPDAAPSNETLEASQILSEKDNLTIRFDLPYLPLGFHARLVHSLFTPNGNVSITVPTDIWRQGFILRHEAGCAVVHYLLRKNIIEVVLAGSLSGFAELLSTLFVNLKSILTGGNGIRPDQIHPSVLLNKHIFSVHSAEDLVKVLSQITNYDQLINEVTKMAGTYNIEVGANSQVAVNAKEISQQHGSNNVTLTADQRQQIAEVVGELLANSTFLKGGELVQVAKVQEALENPDKPESSHLLGKIGTSIDNIAGFAKDKGIPIAKFLLENKEKLQMVFGS